MLEDGFVEFPEATKKVSEKKNTPQLIENAPYELNKTGNAHIISIQNSAMNDLNKGDIIAAFNANDLCVGMAQYKGGNQNLALVVYGDDFTTDNSDGMLADEVMSFGIYSPGTDDLTEVNPQWNLSMTHTNRFAENGLSMITGFKNTTGVTENLLGELSIYPNPNTGLFHVEGISCKVDIQVLNSTGQLIRQIEANSSVEINLSSYAKGIYYLKLVSEDEVRIEKIIME
jgi:hypothetical protein